MRILARSFSLLALTSTAFAQDPAQKGLEIAIMADKANEGYGSEKSAMTLQLINAHGQITERKMTMEVLEVASDGDRARSVFEWPADVKGTKLLTWSHKTSDDDQWLYLPAIKRVKRIASNNKSGSFMGSEFSYEDLSSQEVEKYKYKYLDELELAGRATYHMERYPVDANSGYQKQVVWMDKEYLSPLKIEYFDRKGELLKVGTFEGYEKLGKFWRWAAIRIDNVQTKKKSVISWSKRQLGVALSPQIFDSARLEN